MTHIDPIDPDVAPAYVSAEYLERELFARFAENDRLDTGRHIPESTIYAALPDRGWLVVTLKSRLADLISRGIYDYGFTGRSNLEVHYQGNTAYPVRLFTESDPDHPHLEILRVLAESLSDEPGEFSESVDYDTLSDHVDLNPDVVASVCDDLAESGVVFADDTEARLKPWSAAEAWDVLKQYGAVDC